MKHSLVRNARKKSCKSAQKETVYLAFSCNFNRVPLAFTRRMHILHMCATLLTPKVYCQLRLVSLPPFSHPSITIGVSPPSTSLTHSIGLPTNAIPIQSSYTRSLFLFSILFRPLSFAALPRVCLLRSLVGIISWQR